ncbi:AAEL004519-PA [Aedes aegypti]|nr:AAEL004519-PA [Aedes aegypti]
MMDSGDSQLIFKSGSASLDAWIEDLTSLKILNVPNAPASLCSNCNTILKNFDEFRAMCFTNNSSFNELFVSIDRRNEFEHSYYSPNDDAVQNIHNEYVVSNVTELIESKDSDPLPPSIEIVKIEIEEDNSDSDDQAEAHVEIPAQPTENKEKPKDKRQKLCPVCNIYVSALGKHLITLHKDYKPFQCEYCSLRFNAHGNLLKHVRRHMQEKSHICQYCQKGFNNTGELKVHIRMHTNERPYHCEECGKTYKTSGLMGRHKKVHLGIRPHECRLCQARFYIPRHLKQHMTVHTLERAYSCKVCNKKFTRPEAARVNAHKCIKQIDVKQGQTT